MAANVTLNGATYSDINSIKVPTSEGGMAVFDLRSDTPVQRPLYPLVDGSHIFSNGTTVSVTNGNHVTIDYASNTSSSNGTINFSDVGENTSEVIPTSGSNAGNKSTKFVIPAGSTAICCIYNVTNASNLMFNVFGKVANVGMAMTNMVNGCYVYAKKFTEDTEVGCIFASLNKAGTYEFDVLFAVDGERWV